MATINQFDLVGDDDMDDSSQSIAAAQRQKEAVTASASPSVTMSTSANMPKKPVPPSQSELRKPPFRPVKDDSKPILRDPIVRSDPIETEQAVLRLPPLPTLSFFN